MASPFKDFTIQVKEGELVYREEDEGAMMYVIQSGAVELFREVDGQRVSYGVLERGDFFGELSMLLESQPRTTNAVAVEAAALVEINTTLFDKMIRGNIEIAVRMLRKISLRLREFEDRLKESTPVMATASVASAPAPDPGSTVPPPIPRVEPKPTPMPRAAATGVPEPQVPPPPIPTAAPTPRPVHSAPAPPPTAAREVAGGQPHASLSSQDGSHQFALTRERNSIGRFDPVTGMRPDVDLSAVDINRSVSRHHARLAWSGTEYTLTEEVGVLNGTFLNGRRLTTGQASVMHDGDEVGLGMVRLRFHVLGSK